MFPVETLETRVLLSRTTSLWKSFALSERDFSPSPVMIVPLVVHATGEVAQPASAIDGPVGLAAGPQPETTPPAQTMAAMGIAGTMDLSPPSANIAIAGADESTSGGQETSAPIMTVASYSTVALGEESVPPLVVMAGPVMEAMAGGGPVSNPPTWYSGQTPLPAATNEGVAVSGQVPGPSSGGAISVADIPDARHVEFDSTLDSTHGSMSIVIPVDPSNEAFGVSLHAMAPGGPGDVPVVDNLVLEDRKGDPIAELGPFGGPKAPAQIRALTVALENAPVGGYLLVQVSLPTVSTAGPATATASPQDMGSTLPFMMDIQRQNLTAAMTSDMGLMVFGPLSGQVGSGIGTLTNAFTTSQDENATNSVDSSSADSEAGAQTAVEDQGNVIPTAEDAPETGEDRNGGLDLGVGTGPLVSRSSAPLGPMLATLLADPAPPVDRHERALSQAIEDSGSEIASDNEAWSWDDSRDLTSMSALPSGPTTYGTPDGTRVATAGLGAFPLKVTGDESQDTDLESLLATLPGSLDELQTLGVVATTEHERGDISVAVASAHDSPRTDRVAPNFLTTACGLALGLGLTARPLLPDLLALVPPRFSRRRRSVAGSSAGHESTAEGAGGMGNWIRGPLENSRPRREQP